MACNPRMHKMANHTAYKSIGTTLYDTIRGRPHDHVSTNTYIGSISKDLVGHITTFLPTHTLAQMALTNRFIGKSVINTPLQSLRLTAKICANFFRSTLRLNQFRKLRCLSIEYSDFKRFKWISKCVGPTQLHTVILKGKNSSHMAQILNANSIINLSMNSTILDEGLVNFLSRCSNLKSLSLLVDPYLKTHIPTDISFDPSASDIDTLSIGFSLNKMHGWARIKAVIASMCEQLNPKKMRFFGSDKKRVASIIPMYTKSMRTYTHLTVPLCENVIEAILNIAPKKMIKARIAIIRFKISEFRLQCINDQDMADTDANENVKLPVRIKELLIQVTEKKRRSNDAKYWDKIEMEIDSRLEKVWQNVDSCGNVLDISGAGTIARHYCEKGLRTKSRTCDQWFYNRIDLEQHLLNCR
eukprot:278323_1